MSEAREIDLTLMMADLCGYTALTEAHGALQASETVLRFVRLAKDSLEPGVRIVDSIGDAVFCAGPDTLAVVRTALCLRAAVAREPDFPQLSTGIHAGRLVEREGRLFGSPINLTARLASHAEGGQVLCTQQIAQVLPAASGVRSRAVGEQRFRNVVQSVALFALTQSGESEAATGVDPVCHMQVRVDRAAAKIDRDGASFWFCSTHCAGVFSAAPDLYVKSPAREGPDTGA